MRCYDAIIKEMEELADSYRNPPKGDRYHDEGQIAALQVQFLQEKLQTALRENWELTELAKQRTEQLDEIARQLADDLDFQNESVVMSISRYGTPTVPSLSYVLRITTGPGMVKMALNGRQFQTLAEVCRLQKLMTDMAREGVIDYTEVSISDKEMGSEVTLHI